MFYRGRHRLRTPLWIKFSWVGIAGCFVAAAFSALVVWTRLPDPTYTAALLAQPVTVSPVAAPTTSVEPTTIPTTTSAPQRKKSVGDFGGVSPQIAAVGKFLKSEFDLKTVSGIGDNPSSDHKKGLALDFVVPDHETGDDLVDCAERRRDEWNIAAILWSDPEHQEHVHISFKAKGEVRDLTC